MKLRTLFYPVLAAFLMVAACEPDTPEKPEDETKPEIKGFQLSAYDMSFTADAGEQTVEITTAKAWTASSNAAWCSVSPASGEGSATVSVKAEANPSKESGRSAKVFFKYDDLTVTLMVSQEVSSEAPVFTITPSAVTVPAGGGGFGLTVVSDAIEYEVTVVDSWLEMVSRSGDRHTGETLSFTAAPNEGPTSRTGVISVCTLGGSCIPVMITQEAGNALYAHNHMAMRFTATWCGYCPYMDETFHKVAERRSDFKYMTVHASTGYPLYFFGSGPLVNAYDIQGFPTGVLNGWQEINNSLDTNANANAVVEELDKFDAAFNCVAGIGISSSVTAGVLNVKAVVETGVSEDFLVSAFVLESGIVEPQTYYPSSGGSTTLSDFVHDNVVRTALTDSVLGDKFSATAKSPVEFSWSATLQSGWKEKNLSVLVCVHRSYASSSQKAKRKYPDTYIVNARLLPIGGSAPVEYDPAKQ